MKICKNIKILDENTCEKYLASMSKGFYSEVEREMANKELISWREPNRGSFVVDLLFKLINVVKLIKNVSTDF